MHKQEITYTDFNGNERKEDFYFNISKFEIGTMQSANTPFTEKLERVAKSMDGELIVDMLKEVILMSYGEKSEDGRHFIKIRDGKPLREEFVQTPAFEELFFELVNDPEKAKSFMKSIIPPIPKNN